MARKSKLTPDTQARIVQLLEVGCTVEDAAAQVGITKQTYYNWCKWGEERKSGSYFDFLDASTRAMSRARVVAVTAIRSALAPQHQVTDATETVTETRLRKVRKDGAVIEEPYTYTKTVTRNSVTKLPPDWRAGIDYLKRRDKLNWSERTETVSFNVDAETMRRFTEAAERAGVSAADLFNAMIVELSDAEHESGSAAGG
jgi:hypothetical protein